MSPMRISAAINLVGLALMTPFGLAQALRFDFGAVAAPTWALLAFYALAASVASTWLWLSDCGRCRPARQAYSRSPCRWRRAWWARPGWARPSARRRWRWPLRWPASRRSRAAIPERPGRRGAAADGTI
jgi:hypothetical protein